MEMPNFGMRFNPFDKARSNDGNKFVSNDMREMSTRLDYLTKVLGIGLFTAGSGMGKTFSIKCFSERVNDNLFEIQYVSLSTVTVREFYCQLSEKLGLPARGTKPVLFREIQEQIWNMYKEKRKPLILIIDEAQYLSAGILQDLKMIMNYGYDSLNCFALVLCGEPYLNNMLCRPIHEALRQRIVIHYNFTGLTGDEIAKYIRHKISIGGGAENIISDAAITAVYGYSHGTPRLVDNVMTDALTLATQQQRTVIDEELMMAAIGLQALY